MSDVIIRAENLGKQYRIGQLQHKYETLRDKITESIGNIFHQQTTFDETNFWALKDISFELKQGDVIGIIGRNGAGKSTLLKILSKITEPTTGKVVLHGRIGSLLEVGTGFHPELTGRENIFLNGAILGMKRVEIKAKFDDIVSFAEVEKFIDTAVKHYSSGMYMRLAFAVAAYLEPEILLVDEVLAVGDAQFQKKCLGKMGEVAKQGRTILFVSHNLDAVVRLCTRGMLLQSGKLIYSGTSDQVITQYLSNGEEASSTFIIDYSTKVKPEGPAYILSGAIYQEGPLLTKTGMSQGVLYSKPWCIKIRYRVTTYVNNVTCGIRIVDQRESYVLNTCECFTENMQMERKPGVYEATCHIPAELIMPGKYSLDIGLDYIGGTCIQGLRGVAYWKIFNDDPILGSFQDGRLVGVIGSKITPWIIKKEDE